MINFRTLSKICRNIISLSFTLKTVSVCLCSLCHLFFIGYLNASSQPNILQYSDQNLSHSIVFKVYIHLFPFLFFFPFFGALGYL